MRSRARPAIFVLLFLLSAWFVAEQCEAQTSAAGKQVTILSYNVDNLFDATLNGTEYPEYRPRPGRWNERLYRTRLTRTAKVIRESTAGGPDIVVLEEVENPSVIETLSNDYLRSLGYRQYVMVPVRGSAVNVGLLSRFPVVDVKAHQVRANTEHPLRNILEVTLDCHGVPLTIFACHWKSKSGGSEETEQARRIAAHIIITRMDALLSANPHAEALVVGDLNENVDEYERAAGQYQTALIDMDERRPQSDIPSRYAQNSIFVFDRPNEIDRAIAETRTLSPAALVLFTPWGTAPRGSGSYWYHGSWETIDQFLLAPGLLDRTGLSFKAFKVDRNGYLLNRLGHPSAWTLRTARGYSDHLPILLTLTTN